MSPAPERLITSDAIIPPTGGRGAAYLSDDMWSYLADFADDIVKQERDRIRVVLEEPKVVFSNQRQDGSEWWAYCGLPFPPGPVPTAEASLDFPDAPTYIVYAQPVVVEAERGEILVRQYQMDPSPTGTPRNWDRRYHNTIFGTP